MKKTLLFLPLFAICGVFCFSQQSVFVSASGSDANSGYSEDSPFRTFAKAIEEVGASSVNRITIIGVLDAGSETQTGRDSVFTAALPVRASEILITGPRSVSGADQAVLSGGNLRRPVLAATGVDTRIRLENIEISGSNGEVGVLVSRGSSITLGPGAVVRDNETGIKINEGTCIIDGGEVRENAADGIIVNDLSVLIMRGGFIRDNRGGGVFVQSGGRFSMSSGYITGNYASITGAGVYVQAGGRFDQISGTVAGNISPEFPDIYREPGAFGNDLSMTVSVPPSDSPSDDQEAFEGVQFQVPLYIKIYGQGWRENLFSAGLLLQIGFEVDFGKVLGIALLGEVDGGIGYPYILEGSLLGMFEMYFAGRKIGFGGGYGIYGRTLHIDDLSSNTAVETASDPESFFYRFKLIFPFPVKTAIYANYYDRKDWGNMENWSFGVQVGMNIFNRSGRQ